VNGNGTDHHATYSPERGFLQAISTMSSQGQAIQNLVYHLDPTGRADGVTSGFPGES
jgi:hypothetical protein